MGGASTRPPVCGPRVDSESLTPQEFERDVLSCFGFLTRFGFVAAGSEEWRIRFASPQVWIDVFYGERDGEVGIEFGRVESDERLSFNLFVCLHDRRLFDALGDMTAYDKLAVREQLLKLAGALVSVGMDIVDGRQQAFDEMTRVRWWDCMPEALRNGDQGR